MDDSITKQAMVEREMLKHLEQALRIALDWNADPSGSSRKLSTLRFVAESFQRHLHRLKALDEHDGIMKLILSTAPHMQPRIESLQKRRDELMLVLDRIVSQLDRFSHDDHDSIAALCAEFVELLDEFASHGQKEIVMLQKALTQDIGGEG